MESIKQEIVNNVYENGEQLITGPVLQEVLLDIVDDYNGKIRSGSVPQDLVGKTGSWDDAADWVEQNSSSVVLQSDLEGYATEDWVEDQGYLKEHQDISGLATTQSLNELSESVAQSIADIPEVDLSGYATTESVETLVNETSESVKEWVEAQRYLTSASLSGSVTEETVGFMINDATASVKEWVEDKNYATETFVSESIAGLDIPSTEGFATTESLNQLSESVANDFANLDIPDISGLATTESVSNLSESVAETIANLPQADLSGYLTTASYTTDSASFDERINAITGSDLSGYATTESLNSLSESVAESFENLPEVDLSGYATTSSVNEATSSVKEWVQEQGYLTEHQDISGLATTESVNSLSQSVAESIENIDLSEYATTSSVESSISEATESVKEWVEAQRYLTTASLSGSVTEESVQYMINDATSSVKDWVGDQNYATETFVSESIAAIPGTDLTGYATEAWVQEQGYLTEHQDISGLATTSSVIALSQSVAQDFENLDIPDVSGLATSESVSALSESVRSLGNQVNGLGEDLDTLNGTVAGLASTSSLNSLSKSVAIDLGLLDERVTEVEDNKVDWDTYDTEKAEFSQSVAGDVADLSASIAAITGSDLSGYVTTASYNQDSASFDERINAITGSDLSGYATTESLNQLSESVAEELETKADEESVYNILAGTGLAEPEYGEWTIYEAAKEDDLREVSSSLSASIAAITGSNLSGYATTESVSNLSESVAESIASIQVPDVSGFLPTSSYLVDSASFDERIDSIVVPDVTGLATTESVNQLSSSFDERINNIITGSGVDLSGYATTESVNQLSESVASDFANLDIPDVSIYTPTASFDPVSASFAAVSESYRYNILYLYSSRSIADGDTISSPGFYSNWYWEVSGSQTLLLGSPLGYNRSIEVFVHNVGASDITISFNSTYFSRNSVVNGVEGSGSFTIPAREFGDIVATQIGDRVYFRTSLDVDIPEVDLSGYATTASLNSVSESLSASIAAITASGGESGDYLPLTGGTLTAGEESDATVLELTAPDGGGGYMSLEASNNRENPDWPGYGGSTLTIGGNEGEVILHDGPFIDYSWKNGEDEFVSATINFPEIDGDGTLVVQEDLTSLSESISQSIAAITSSGGGSGSGTDTDLRNYLFGVATQLVTGITGSVTNIFSSISQNSTLGFSGVPDEGRSLSITILNNAASTSTITLPESVVVGSDTFNLINNGVDGSGSMSIPAGEYGDIVVTRHGSDIYVRTSVNLDDINVDLSGYATTSSLNSVSESISQSIADIPEVDLSGYATTESVNQLSESVAQSIVNILISSGGVWLPGDDGTGAKIGDTYSISGSVAEGTGSSALGEYSHAEGYKTLALESHSHAEGHFATASGIDSHAEGQYTIAIGLASHAEGTYTTASGESSHAEGRYATALGNYSHAEGWYTEATGEYSHAEGYHTQVSGQYSHAEGNQTRTTGNYSHAEGSQTTASGGYSHAEGESTLASGQSSHAEGNGVLALNWGSHAEGNRTLASGQFSHAEGRYATASGNFSHAEGSASVALGFSSHAEGQGTVASGDYSHAEGSSTKASGSWSHAEGYRTLASGSYSHAEGQYTTSSGDYSHAEGALTAATGNYSHAEGQSTKALGTASHAEGQRTTALGNYSHAEGYYTTASNAFEHAQGKYNATVSSQIFSVGTGDAEANRKNAISIITGSGAVSSASVYIYGIGGYDGTNPNPGVNDIVSVISNLTARIAALEGN